MPDAVFVAKLMSSVSIVVLLSWIAERVSPRVSGILSGYPLGAAIALFFYGVEISPEFAASFSRGKKWTELDMICRERGF